MSVGSSSSARPIAEVFPEGLLQGGELVTARAKELVSGKCAYKMSVQSRAQPQSGKLRTSRFNTPEDIASFAQKFDEGLKRVFSDNNGTQYIKFGSPRDNDPQHGIRAGKLTLTG